MLTSFFSFFVVYVLVVFVALLWFFWQDSRFFWLAWINLLSLLIFFIISFLIKKQEKSNKQESAAIKEDKIRYPQQFVKYPHIKKKNKSNSIFWYLLLFFLLLFLFSVVDLTILHRFWQVVWVFPLLYLISLFISGKNLIDNKLKIFWFIFDFYLFLFISSFIVGLLVYWTLSISILPILLLSALLVSFLFFFVWYLFIKNQWFRSFFGLVYSKIYFILIFVVLLRSFLIIPPKHTIKESIENFSSTINKFFQKQNIDPLLYTWQWEVITSGFVEPVDDDYIFEESWEVVTWVNPIFVSDESMEIISWSLDQQDVKKILKEELDIIDTNNVSMIDALRFLMEANKISLSTKTNTKFTYVSSTNPFYPYWKTAYENKIIWASTNPNTKITCETYQVFKGMLLDRKLKYSPANVKKVFWSEAEKQAILNWCEYGKLLKWENL